MSTEPPSVNNTRTASSSSSTLSTLVTPCDPLPLTGLTTHGTLIPLTLVTSSTAPSDRLYSTARGKTSFNCSCPFN
jgi:hypothetical protein